MRSAWGEFACGTPASVPCPLLLGLIQANVSSLTRDGCGLRVLSNPQVYQPVVTMPGTLVIL